MFKVNSVKEINQELEEYARKYEAVQRHRRSANSPLTAPADRPRLWSRQDSCESGRGVGGSRVCDSAVNSEDAGRSAATGEAVSYTNGELVSGISQ